VSSQTSDPRLRLLVVDDELVVQRLVASLFDDDAAQVLLASSVSEALVHAEAAARIDVALVDKNLPDRSGLELAAELKGLDPDIEILLITGYASLDSAITAIHLDVFDYVVKPFDHIDHLRRKIVSASEKARLKRERRRMVAQMTTSVESFQALIDSSPSAVIVFDLEQQVVQDVNERAILLYGYEREELIGLPVSELRRCSADGAWTARDRSGTEFQLEVKQTTFERLGRVIETAYPRSKL
jgi:two-component system cell cycle sensor histidine kinase/response regulator CckA